LQSERQQLEVGDGPVLRAPQQRRKKMANDEAGITVATALTTKMTARTARVIMK
jgi:hypothetical protein